MLWHVLSSYIFEVYLNCFYFFSNFLNKTNGQTWSAEVNKNLYFETEIILFFLHRHCFSLNQQEHENETAWLVTVGYCRNISKLFEAIRASSRQHLCVWVCYNHPTGTVLRLCPGPGEDEESVHHHVRDADPCFFFLAVLHALLLHPCLNSDDTLCSLLACSSEMFRHLLFLFWPQQRS